MLIWGALILMIQVFLAYFAIVCRTWTSGVGGSLESLPSYLIQGR